MNTDIKKVQRFYSFWFEFDSWREFHHEDEYNLEEAENRYEKRYMEKENKKLKGKMIKQEMQRIKNLVSLAYENDPRIKAHSLKIEEEKNKRKEEKKKQKERLIQEKVQKEREEEEQKVN